MHWDDARIFLAVAREGSFSSAAKPLGVQHSTVSRRIHALEKQLASPLLERHNRYSRYAHDHNSYRSLTECDNGNTGIAMQRGSHYGDSKNYPDLPEWMFLPSSISTNSVVNAILVKQDSNVSTLTCIHLTIRIFIVVVYGIIQKDNSGKYPRFWIGIYSRDLIREPGHATTAS
jgi:hypothetical protein